MAETALPTTEADVADIIADALRVGSKLSILGGGTKAEIGAPVEARPLPMNGLSGVVDYDPAELVLTVKPGTALADVQKLVADAGQMLAFEPFDHGPIFGHAPGGATIGGVIAAGVSGSQRISALAARDHLLGFRAVSGRGEIFCAGAKVVKNVTGYDLPKLATGSWGRLFAMTELTLKVLPRPMETTNLVLRGLDERQAVQAMSAAMGSQADVAAAAHIPEDVSDGQSVTILRIQGFGPSVSARRVLLENVLEPFGRLHCLPQGDGDALWTALRTLEPLGATSVIWRLSVPARQAGELSLELRKLGGRFMLDWAGGLIWFASNADAVAIRTAVEVVGGNAALIRAEEVVRARTPTLHPQSLGVAALEERVRRAFDPVGVFETGRF